MVNKDEKENDFILTLGFLGLIVYVVIRMFLMEYKDYDILIYPMVIATFLTLVTMFVPMNILDKVMTPKLIVVVQYMAVVGFIIFFLSYASNIEIFKEIDLILVSLGVIATRFIEFNG